MKSLKGHLLIAAPDLFDPNFHQTVTLVLEHNSDGAAGVVLNRPSSRTIQEISREVFEEESDWDVPIHIGGPVPGPLHAIHTVEELADLTIFPGLHDTVDPFKLHELVRRKAEPVLFVANLAGWGPGQLESEIEQDSWRIIPARPDHLFRDWGQERCLWRASLAEQSDLVLKSTIQPRSWPVDPRAN